MLVFRRLTRFMTFTGFRLAEIVGDGSGEIMFITYGRPFWCIGNVMVAAPTRAQLLNLRPGRDSAVVFPPRRPTSAPATTAGHHAARRRRGRPSRPLAGLLLQRARRRRVGSHDTPCPRIDCRVSFGVAQTRDGRPYKDGLLPLNELRVVAV